MTAARSLGASGAERPTLHSLRDHHHVHACPLCGGPMAAPGMLPGSRAKQGRGVRSRAHVLRKSLHRALWVYVCQGCNSDQRDLTMPQWLMELAARGDARASPLADLLGVVLRSCRV